MKHRDSQPECLEGQEHQWVWVTFHFEPALKKDPIRTKGCAICKMPKKEWDVVEVARAKGTFSEDKCYCFNCVMARKDPDEDAVFSLKYPAVEKLLAALQGAS
jgi:hypothetical protein